MRNQRPRMNVQPLLIAIVGSALIFGMIYCFGR